jgi:hypothetical protein
MGLSAFYLLFLMENARDTTNFTTICLQTDMVVPHQPLKQ